VREYGRVHSAFWSSADIQSLSDDGKLLALYLLSCSHGTIAGVCRLPDGYVSEDLKWTSGRVAKGFDELFSKGFANRCETTKWVWIRKFLQWNAPENPNQWKAVWKVVGQIPAQCAWRSDFLGFLSKLTGKEPPPEANPSETVSEPFRNHIPSQLISTATGSQQESERRAREKPGGVERTAGAIDFGTRLTAITPTSLLEDWRRDVPECNPDAFARWIVHVEELGKVMSPAMRLAQARRLAGNGDFAVQAEVVTYCAENGYKSLIPIVDVRHRTHGRDPPGAPAKLTWRPPPDEEPASASG
jgi:hypothetical protein